MSQNHVFKRLSIYQLLYLQLDFVVCSRPYVCSNDLTLTYKLKKIFKFLCFALLMQQTYYAWSQHSQ